MGRKAKAIERPAEITCNFVGELAVRKLVEGSPRTARRVRKTSESAGIVPSPLFQNIKMEISPVASEAESSLSGISQPDKQQMRCR